MPSTRSVGRPNPRISAPTVWTSTTPLVTVGLTVSFASPTGPTSNASVPALESAVTPETSPPKVCSCKVARMPAVDQVTSALELPMVPLLPAEGCKLTSFTFA